MLQNIERITVTNCHDLAEAKLRKLARRAVKIGVDFAWCVESRVDVERKRYNRLTGSESTVLDDVTTFAISHGRVQLSGWQFLAALDHERHLPGSVIRTLPSAPADFDADAWRTADTECEHCGTRRFRKTTYVLRNAELRAEGQVGSSCLVDFLGADAARIVKGAEFVADLGGFGEEFEGMGGGRPLQNSARLLAWVALCIDSDGWVSKGTAYENPDKVATVETALSGMNYTGPPKYAPLPPKDEHVAEGVAALKWAREIDENETGYLANLRNVAQADVFIGKHAGLIGSAVIAYRRSMEREANRVARESADAAKVNEFVGEIGDKLREIEVTVTFRQERENYRGDGYSSNVAFEDADGRRFFWRASRDLEGELSKGDRVKLSGNVKAHDDYNDRRSTVLTRCKVAEIEPAPFKCKRCEDDVEPETHEEADAGWCRDCAEYVHECEEGRLRDMADPEFDRAGGHY